MVGAPDSYFNKVFLISLVMWKNLLFADTVFELEI